MIVRDTSNYRTPPSPEPGGLYRASRERSDRELPALLAAAEQREQQHAEFLSWALKPIPPAPFDEQFQERFVETLRLHPDFRGAVRAWLEATA